MLRFLLGVLLCMCAVPASRPARAADPVELERFDVQIRGFLQKSASTNRYTLRARGIDVILTWAEAGKPPAVDSMANQLVSVRGGMLRSDQNELICEVQGDIRPIKATQYLVGYEPRHLESIKQKLGQLSLYVEDDYRPGKYLVMVTVEPPEENQLDQLRKMEGVRYVETNKEYSIKRKGSR